MIFNKLNTTVFFTHTTLDSTMKLILAKTGCKSNEVNFIVEMSTKVDI